MNNLENEYRKRFSDQKQQVSPSDADDLWSAIASDLDNDPKPAGSSRRLLKIPAVIALLALMCTGLWLITRQHEMPAALASENHQNIQSLKQNQDITVENANSATPAATPVPAENSNVTASPSASNVVIPDNTTAPFKNQRITASSSASSVVTSDNTSSRIFSKTPQTEKTQQKTNTTIPLQPTLNTNPKIKPLQSTAGQDLQAAPNTALTEKNNTTLPTTLTEQPSLQKQSEHPAFSSTDDQQASSLLHAANSPSASEHPAPFIKPTTENLSDTLPFISENNLKSTVLQELANAVSQKDSTRTVVIEKAPEVQEHISEIVPVKQPKKQTLLKWHFGLESGLNIANILFKSANNSVLADQKNSLEKPDWGYSAALRGGMLWKNKWAVNTGIEYHNFWTVFKTEYKSNVSVMLDSQLVKVFLDASSGQVLRKVYADTSVTGVATRTIEHHNQYQQISLPLEIGMEKHTGKWMFGLNAGAVFSYTFRQAGRTLGATAPFVDFDKNSTAAPLKTFGIGLRVNPVLGYHLNERTILLLKPQWTTQQRSSILNSDMRANAHFWEMNIGLRYNLR